MVIVQAYPPIHHHNSNPTIEMRNLRRLIGRYLSSWGVLALLVFHVKAYIYMEYTVGWLTFFLREYLINSSCTPKWWDAVLLKRLSWFGLLCFVNFSILLPPPPAFALLLSPKVAFLTSVVFACQAAFIHLYDTVHDSVPEVSPVCYWHIHKAHTEI